jgi:hypothetical protein
MTTSSVPPAYSTILNDTITISSGSSSGSTYYYNTGAGVSGGTGNITIANGGAVSGTISTGTFTIGGAGSGHDWIYKFPEEFVDSFPEWSRIEDMCKQYPGLRIAFEKFKTTYYLVKDDYDTPEDKRPKP